MKEISDSRYFNMPILDKSVGHFMTENVDTIESTLSVFDAAAIFSKSSRRRYPVLEKGSFGRSGKSKRYCDRRPKHEKPNLER